MRRRDSRGLLIANVLDTWLEPHAGTHGDTHGDRRLRACGRDKSSFITGGPASYRSRLSSPLIVQETGSNIAFKKTHAIRALGPLANSIPLRVSATVPRFRFQIPTRYLDFSDPSFVASFNNAASAFAFSFAFALGTAVLTPRYVTRYQNPPFRTLFKLANLRGI